MTVFTRADIEEMAFLGARIVTALLCNKRTTLPKFPCDSDRENAVMFMARYLELHGYRVEKNLDSPGLPAVPAEGDDTEHLYNQTQRSGGVADA